MGRRVVMLQVVGVGKCCGWLDCLGICMGQRLNLAWLKLRILGWIMDRQTCSNCTYKLVLLSTNENQCCGACAVFSYMRDCLEKHKKKVYKNLTEMLMFPYRSEVAEWTWRWYCCGCGLVSNVLREFEHHIWKEYKLCVWWAVTYVILVCDWKKWNRGEGTECWECLGIEARASEGSRVVNIKLVWWLIWWTGYKVSCKTRQKLVFRNICVQINFRWKHKVW